MSPATATPTGRARTTPRVPRTRNRSRPLAHYTQADGLRREIITIPAAAGSTLLIDRLAGGLGDSRLLAHMAADEPAENAQLICSMYLADTARPTCRRATEHDLRTVPLAAAEPHAAAATDVLHDDAGHTYRIRPVDERLRQLRWTRTPSHERSPSEVLSLRDLVGTLQSYSPTLTITCRAIASRPAGTSTTRLAGELRLLERSPIVLNRGLREAVVHAIEHEQVSMSEIAIRCGRARKGRDGSLAGETSWLGRRIGLRPDTTTGRPTPWVHTDVLAVIARHGLGLAPAEVEVR